MPTARVAAAELNDLKVCIGRVSFFMNLWSCSIILLRYFTWRISISQHQLCITSKQFMLNSPAALDPLLSMTTLSGQPLLAITLAKNAIDRVQNHRFRIVRAFEIEHSLKP